MLSCVYQTTTLEGSEIDRVKKMVRRGKIKEVRLSTSLYPDAALMSLADPVSL